MRSNLIERMIDSSPDRSDYNLNHSAVKIYIQTTGLTPNEFYREKFVGLIKWATKQIKALAGYTETEAILRSLDLWRASILEFGRDAKRIDWVIDHFQATVMQKNG